MDFPTSEADIMALSQQMLDGYFWHNIDFPKINRRYLIGRHNTYISARKDLLWRRSYLRVQTKRAERKLLELKQVMKNCLQKSEVDVASNPEKLKLIGWGPRTEPQPAQLPGQPMNLRIVAKDDRIVKLEWDRPEDDQRVRNYIIERRQQNGDVINDWFMVQISYSTQASLRNQPVGIQLEYRVKATNNAGTGPFSSTASVVL
jgi:hypothetical protein